MLRISKFCEWLLGRAVVWGAMGALAFYALVVERLDRDGALYGWLAGDFWQFKALCSVLFFTGLAAVGLKLLRSAAPSGASERSALPMTQHTSEPVDEPVASDPQIGAVLQLCEQVLQTVHVAVAQHDAALTKAIGSTTRRWEEAASTAAALLHRTVGEALAAGLKGHAQSLNEGVSKYSHDLEGVLLRHAQILSDNIDQHTGALADALEHHTAVITQTETHLASENRRHIGELEGALGEAVLIASARQEKLVQQSENLLREMQSALVEAAGTTVAQQEQLIRQGEVLLKVVEATGQVRRLEEVLNQNLSALATSHRFEETVVGLSAALQMLSAKFGRQLIVRDEINLDGHQPASQAA